ncbi:MAG: thioredoxin domain-containing protein [bacterium]|nr:thioredoxin domain-containing protein [bacterium]
MGDEELVLRMNSDSFQREVIRSKGPFVFAVVAPWCPTSKLLESVLEQVAAREAGKVLVGRMDISEDPFFVERSGNNTIPTLSLYLNEEEKSCFIGERSERNILLWIHECCNGGAHGKS